jgi:hypothetical protein
MRLTTTRLLIPAAVLALVPALMAAGPSTQPADGAAAAAAAGAPDLDLFRDVRQSAAKRQRDPIGPLATKMTTIAAQLDDLQTDGQVQARQQAVLGSLNAIIKQIEEQKGSGSGSNPNPTKPAPRSQITKGPGGEGPLHDPRSGTKTWAQLPAKDREQITQSQTEGFPPGYESVLASYYSRLSQEQVAGGDATAAPAAAAMGPTTQPAGR